MYLYQKLLVMNNKYTFLLIAVLIGYTVTAQKYKNTENMNVSKEWNGNSFSSSISLVDNIAEVADFSLMKKALKNKTILNALESEEMITVFIITNNGFKKMQEKQDSIFDASKANLLTNIIKYHVIPGRVDSHSIKESIKRKGNSAFYATLQGEKLGIKEKNGQLFLVDNQGNTSIILATDFYHKNGFFHIVDGTVYPK